MKKSNVSVLFVFMLCVLIGYFEPANATGNPYLVVNGSGNVTQIYPNPLNSALFNSYSTSSVVSASVVSLNGGNSGGNCVVEGNAYFEPSVAIFPWFPVDVEQVGAPTNLFAPTMQYGLFPDNTRVGFDAFAAAADKGTSAFESSKTLTVVRPNGLKIVLSDLIKAVVEGNAYFEPANALQIQASNGTIYKYTDYVDAIVAGMSDVSAASKDDFSHFINDVVEGNAYFEPAYALGTFSGVYTTQITLPTGLANGSYSMTVVCANGSSYTTTVVVNK